MKYLILLLALLTTACSSGLTPEQVNNCSELAKAVDFEYYISDKGTCVLKNTRYKTTTYSYYIPIDQIDGALEVVDLQKEMIRAPILDSCVNQCILNIKKQTCPGDRDIEVQECYAKCNREIK